MMSHDLAKLLLDSENLPVATHANNHTNCGAVKVGVMHSEFASDGKLVVIGNFSRMRINYPNEYVTDMWYGEVPEDWVK